MTVVETILVFAGIPLLIVAVLAVLTLRPEKGHKRLRYKPGQPWEHAPVWFEPHPVDAPAHGSDGAHAAIEAPRQPVPGGPLGGARGTW